MKLFFFHRFLHRYNHKLYCAIKNNVDEMPSYLEINQVSGLIISIFHMFSYTSLYLNHFIILNSYLIELQQPYLNYLHTFFPLGLRGAWDKQP